MPLSSWKGYTWTCGKVLRSFDFKKKNKIKGRNQINIYTERVQIQQEYTKIQWNLCQVVSTQGRSSSQVSLYLFEYRYSYMYRYILHVFYKEEHPECNANRSANVDDAHLSHTKCTMCHVLVVLNSLYNNNIPNTALIFLPSVGIQRVSTMYRSWYRFTDRITGYTRHIISSYKLHLPRLLQTISRFVPRLGQINKVYSKVSWASISIHTQLVQLYFLSLRFCNGLCKLYTCESGSSKVS